jgi:site-specific DNA-methyltransferase (adenine-specific)
MNKIEYKIGDARDLIKDLPDNSIDAVVTDPPYEINFMSSKWDRTGIAFDINFWADIKRVMKPGDHACVFGFPRTHHRLMCALEDAGFEIRDVIMWLFGKGFPKGLDISKAIDKMKGAKREVIGNYVNPSGHKYNDNGKLETSVAHGNFIMNREITAPSTPEAKQWHGWKTSLKPAYEPIILVRKPISERNIALNVLKWGTGALNIDGCRIKYDSKFIEKHKNDVYKRKLQYGALSYMIDNVSQKEYNQQGRYPSNIILDEDTAGMLDEQSGISKSSRVGFKNVGWKHSGNIKDEMTPLEYQNEYDDKGGASRFFYCAKVSPSERGKLNRHPTVKPIKLVEHLVKLITPPNGTVLDPFVGSGTTLKACQNLGFNGLGFELDKSNEPVIRKRCHLDSNLAKYLG